MVFVYGILGLGFLVFFHELGHFCAARLSKVTVESFSIGMGPVLLHHKLGNTDFRLSLIPLGGYCGMKGAKDYPISDGEKNVELSKEPDSYYGVNPLKRILIAFAGPFFNFLLTFICFVIIAMMGYKYFSAGTKVSMTKDIYEYSSISSPAQEAGMKSGDEILEINGKIMNDFSDIVTFISVHPDQDIEVKVNRDGSFLFFTVHTGLDKETGSGKMGIVSDPNSIIEREYPARSFFPALLEGTYQTINLISMTFKSLGVLFKGVNLTKTVSGPVRITSMFGDTVKQGFSSGLHTGIISTLEFLALISISLFIMNLLPIPVLDGGLILYSIVELIFHKRMSAKVLFILQLIGFVLIGSLLVLALTGDIQYFIHK